MNQNNSGWGNLSALITNELSKFLDVKDIQSFGAANQCLHKNIDNNPFIQKRIVDSKLTLEKIYDIVHEIALSEYKGGMEMEDVAFRIKFGLIRLAGL